MTQQEKVVEILLKQGYIDNFYCLDNRITIRLGAIIFNLKKAGWDFRTEMNEKNCHYYAIKKPPQYNQEPVQRSFHFTNKVNEAVWKL